MIMLQANRKEEIKKNINTVRMNIQKSCERAGRDVNEIQLMAVTKTVPASDVNIAIDEGIILLGENRAQELLDKYEQYKLGKKSIHFIGHLQTNKIKYIIDKVNMIESVDTIKLAKSIDAYANKINITMDVLLEINIGNQDSKGGFSVDEIYDVLREVGGYKNIKIKGLMAIPPIENVELHFQNMQNIYLDIKNRNFKNTDMQYLSMGMSGDYQLAIQYGANIIRIGTGLFGSRK